MGRVAALLHMILFLFLFSCEEEAVPSPVTERDLLNEVNVDFTVEVIDMANGLVRISDLSDPEVEVYYEVTFENSDYYPPSPFGALPGDIFDLTFERAGTYVITLTGYFEVANGFEGIVFEKTKVKNIEITSNQGDLIGEIVYFRVEEFSFFDRYGQPWDTDGTGPDLEISYRVNNSVKDQVLFLPDFDASSLPITFTLDDPVPVVDGLNFFGVNIYDDDPVEQNFRGYEIIDIVSFSLGFLNPPMAGPGIYELYMNGIYLGIEWKRQ